MSSPVSFSLTYVPFSEFFCYLEPLFSVSLDFFVLLIKKVSAIIFQGVEFKLEIKNLAMSDSKGHDLEKEIVVRVTNVQSKQVSNVHDFGSRSVMKITCC